MFAIGKSELAFIIACFVSIVRIVCCYEQYLLYVPIDSGTMLQKSKLLGVCIKNIYVHGLVKVASSQRGFHFASNL